MSSWITIEEPIRERCCHQCGRTISGEHLRVYIGSGGVAKYVNICWKCVMHFAEQLKRP